MSIDRIGIPQGYGTCTLLARVEAGLPQRITVVDRHAGTTYGPWTGSGFHAEVGRCTLPNAETPLPVYPVEVHLESSADGGATWGENRSRTIPLQVPNPFGCLLVVGSEDIASTDGDFNDAYVMFTFVNLVGPFTPRDPGQMPPGEVRLVLREFAKARREDEDDGPRPERPLELPPMA